jgi:hypothetical protein
MNKKLVKEIILEKNPEALFLEEYFDEAIWGYGKLCSKKYIVAYDSDKCIEILMKTLDISEIEALEQYQLTSEHGEYSDNKPVFVSNLTKATMADSIDEIVKGKDLKDPLEDII